MFAPEDVGKFVRALGDGTLLNEGEQVIYASVYEYEHTGWLPGYQSVAGYHNNFDGAVVQMISTTGEDSELVALVLYDRIVRILSKQHGRD